MKDLCLFILFSILVILFLRYISTENNQIKHTRLSKRILKLAGISIEEFHRRNRYFPVSQDDRKVVREILVEIQQSRLGNWRAADRKFAEYAASISSRGEIISAGEFIDAWDNSLKLDINQKLVISGGLDNTVGTSDDLTYLLIIESHVP